MYDTTDLHMSSRASSAILYERLVNIDKVDLLLAPFGGSSVTANGIAQKYQVLVEHR